MIQCRTGTIKLNTKLFNYFTKYISVLTITLKMLRLRADINMYAAWNKNQFWGKKKEKKKKKEKEKEMHLQTKKICRRKYGELWAWCYSGHRVHVYSPFSLITSIRMSITIKVPVRPIPALKNKTLNNHISFIINDKVFWLWNLRYLQCTVIGPASNMLSCLRLTSSKKSSTPPGSVGTPWSGQALKWYCQTVRSVLPWKTTTKNKESIIKGVHGIWTGFKSVIFSNFWHLLQWTSMMDNNFFFFFFQRIIMLDLHSIFSYKQTTYLSNFGKFQFS